VVDCIEGIVGAVKYLGAGSERYLSGSRESPLHRLRHTRPLRRMKRPSAVRTTALQREESVAAGERTHGKRHQADIRFGHRRWTERQLYEVKLTPDCNWAVSLLNDCSTVVRTGGTEP
jgi:hypothetical protein